MFSDAVKRLQQFVLYNFVSLGEIFTGKLKRGDGGPMAYIRMSLL